MGKILSPSDLQKVLRSLRVRGKRIVFTNGCFDLLHPGHVRYLGRAKSLGDILVVAINSDSSARAIKGGDRPIFGEGERAEILAALAAVDYVTVFVEETPRTIIRLLRPDVLVKGGDWTPDTVIGREEVESWGGEVVVVEYVAGYSTTSILEKIRAGESTKA